MYSGQLVDPNRPRPLPGAPISCVGFPVIGKGLGGLPIPKPNMAALRNALMKQLWGNGEIGGLWDPGPMTCFTDTEALNPAQSGSSVARWDSLGSAAPLSLTRSTVAKQPILTQADNRAWFLRYNAGHHLSGISLVNGATYTYFWAYINDDPPTGHLFMGLCDYMNYSNWIMISNDVTLNTTISDCATISYLRVNNFYSDLERTNFHRALTNNYIHSTFYPARSSSMAMIMQFTMTKNVNIGIGSYYGLPILVPQNLYTAGLVNRALTESEILMLESYLLNRTRWSA